MSTANALPPEIETALDEYRDAAKRSMASWCDNDPSDTLKLVNEEEDNARAALTAAITRSLAAATERAERDADDRNAAIREKIAPAFNALWRDVVGIEEAHHWADHVENIDQVDRAISAALGTPTFYEQFREQFRAVEGRET